MSRYYNDYLQHSDEDTLTHFGVPGMKWGQRKSLADRMEDYRSARDAQKVRKIQRFGLLDKQALKNIQDFKRRNDPSKLTDAQRRNLKRTEQYYLDKKAGKAVHKKGILRKMSEAHQFKSRSQITKEYALAGGVANGLQTYGMVKLAGGDNGTAAKLAARNTAVGAGYNAASAYAGRSLSRLWGKHVSGKAVG